MPRASVALAASIVAVSVVALGAAQAKPAPQAQAKPAPARVTLPPAIQANFVKSYPEAKVLNVSKETENGKVEYQIESMDGTQRRDLIYLTDGTLVLYEELIPVSAVPKAVVDAVKTRYAKATISRSEKLFQNGTMTYELVLKGAPRVSEVELTPEGQWVSPKK